MAGSAGTIGATGAIGAKAKVGAGPLAPNIFGKLKPPSTLSILRFTAPLATLIASSYFLVDSGFLTGAFSSVLNADLLCCYSFGSVY